MSAQTTVLVEKFEQRRTRGPTKIQNFAWVLPRPRKSSKYVGGFPLHFEGKLWKLLGRPQKDFVTHPFGGKSEIGLRLDLRAETKPDIIADAHNLPIRSNCMEVVILDPPYSEELAERLYDTAKVAPLKFSQYSREAVRVLKEGGHLVIYHVIATPRVPNTKLVKRIFLETRVWHKLRCIHIHRKSTSEWTRIGLEKYQP